MILFWERYSKNTNKKMQLKFFQMFVFCLHLFLDYHTTVVAASNERVMAEEKKIV